MLALYFPYVYFNNIQWLLSAVLYWDGIGRLVPDGLTLDDPVYIQRLVAAGVVFDVAPSRDDVELVSSAYIERLNQGDQWGPPLPEQPEFVSIEEADRILRADVDPMSVVLYTYKTVRSIEFPRASYQLQRLAQRQAFFVHRSVMTPPLRDRLIQTNMAVDRASLVGFSVSFAREYLADLTSVMAESQGLVPVSPTPMYHFRPARLSGPPRNADVPDAQAAGALFAHFAFRTVGLEFADRADLWSSNTPEAWEDVDRTTMGLLELRERLAPFRAAFRVAVETIAKEMAGVLLDPPEHVVQQHLNALYVANVLPALAILRRELEDARLTARESLLDIKVALPAIAASTAGVMGLQLGQPALIGIAGASAAGAIYRSLRWRAIKRASILGASPMALLHLLDHELSPDALFQFMGIRRSKR